MTKAFQTETVNRAIAYIENETEPALNLFFRSLSSQEKMSVVKENPLAFGNEVDTLINKKFDDKDCTKEVFERSLAGLISSDKKKNIVLLLSPYSIYQNKYLQLYNKRLLDLAKKMETSKV